MLKIKILYASLYSVENEGKSANEGVSIRYFDAGYEIDSNRAGKELGYPVNKASLPLNQWPILQANGIDVLYDASFTIKTKADGTSSIKLTAIKPIKA